MDTPTFNTRSWLKRKKSTTYDDDEEDLLMLLVSDASQFKQKKGGGSLIGKNPNLPRGHLEGHIRLMKDYFNTDCIYPEQLFRRRFRMQRSLFLTIVNKIADHDDYFIQHPVRTRIIFILRTLVCLLNSPTCYRML